MFVFHCLASVKDNSGIKWLLLLTKRSLSILMFSVWYIYVRGKKSRCLCKWISNHYWLEMNNICATIRNVCAFCILFLPAESSSFYSCNFCTRTAIYFASWLNSSQGRMIRTAFLHNMCFVLREGFTRKWEDNTFLL